MYAIIFHAHQKLDRVAHRHLNMLDPNQFFPSISKILKFEGGHGPDGAKLKRQKNGEQPWHFVDPADSQDTKLDKQIKHHYEQLVKELSNKDEVRAAFEAAWLAHALVDGLTPAHHYPYEKELEELRGGEDRNTRNGLAGRLYVKGDTMTSSIKQSLKLVGPGGLLTSHAMFEAGAYTLIAPLTLKKAMPSKAEIRNMNKLGVVKTFRQAVEEIAEMDIFNRFMTIGWTQTLSQEVRRELAPRMVKMITLAWYSASLEAQKVKS